MNPWLPHLYRNGALRRRVPQQTISNALACAQAVQSRGLPAILTLAHLAIETGVEYQYLRKIVSRSFKDDYRVFKISKRHGGKRTICVPDFRLRSAQEWIGMNILERLPAHAAACAYHPKTSILKAASVHCRCRWLIKVDVEKFFESISERQVYAVFLRAGYQPLVCLELARICTRVHHRDAIRYRQTRWSNRRGRYGQIESYDRDGVGHLPQGAPTSPMLSNLAVVALDAEIQVIANDNGLAYTRYADDIVLSSGDPAFGRSNAGRIVRLLYAAMRHFGLRPNISKTTVAPPGGRKIVLGLLVDGDVPRLSRAFRDRLEVHLYGLKEFGVAGHARHRGMSLFGLRRHLFGLAQFARSIEPVFGAALIEQLAELEWAL